MELDFWHLMEPDYLYSSIIQFLNKTKRAWIITRMVGHALIMRINELPLYHLNAHVSEMSPLKSILTCAHRYSIPIDINHMLMCSIYLLSPQEKKQFHPLCFFSYIPRFYDTFHEKQFPPPQQRVAWRKFWPLLR